MSRLDRLLCALLALVFAANAAAMIVDPAGWYAAVPGIERSGPLNPHFVVDIGFAFAVAAGGFAWAAAGPRAAFEIAAMAAAWPALHAAFHLAEWAHHGLPVGAALAGEALGVVLPAAAGVFVAVRMRASGG